MIKKETTFNHYVGVIPLLYWVMLECSGAYYNDESAGFKTNMSVPDIRAQN